MTIELSEEAREHILNALRPKGEWLNKKEQAVNSRGQILYEARCSRCNALSYFRGCSGMLVGANTCPNCSADMRGDTE